MNESTVADLLHRVRDDIDVAPVDPMAVVAAGRQARTRRNGRRAIATVGVVALLAAGIGIAQLTGPAPAPPAGFPAPDGAPMVAGVPLVHGHTLYVDGRGFELDSAPVWVVPVPAGAVVSGEDGRVWLADAADEPATFEQIGTKFWESALVSDPDNGWVAWVDGLTADHPDLVVYDTEARAEVGRWTVPTDGPRYGELDAGTMPLAIDGHTVAVAALDGDYTWDPSVGGGATRLSADDGELLDRDGQTSAARDAAHARLLDLRYTSGADQGSTELEAPDGRVQLSPDGRVVMVTPSRIAAEPDLYAVRTGERLDTGLPAGAVVVDAAFGPGATVTYVLGTLSDADQEPGEGPIGIAIPGPPFTLVTCTLAAPAECAVVWRGPTDDDTAWDGFLLAD